MLIRLLRVLISPFVEQPITPSAALARTATPRRRATDWSQGTFVDDEG